MGLLSLSCSCPGSLKGRTGWPVAARWLGVLVCFNQADLIPGQLQPRPPQRDKKAREDQSALELFLDIQRRDQCQACWLVAASLTGL